jgi:hypothetical protein
MRQADLDRAVARATGESVATIRRLGFLLDDPIAEYDGADSEACASEVYDAVVIDWDVLEAQRYIGSSGRSRCEPALS